MAYEHFDPRGHNPKGGRKPKLEPWRVERFMQALRVLAPIRVYCSYAGITQTTFDTWMRKGRADRESREDDDAAPVSIYEQFLEEFEKVECESELRMLGHIQLAGQKNWTAMAWLLERRRPDDYSRKFLDGGGDGSVTADELADAILRAKQTVQDSVPKPPGWSEMDSTPRLTDGMQKGPDDEGTSDRDPQAGV